MALVLCRLAGAGTNDDPFRCDLPTYTLVAVDYAALLAVADVRDDDVPQGLPRRRLAGFGVEQVTLEAYVVDVSKRGEWEAQIRGRYGGRFAAWDAESAIGRGAGRP